MHILEIVDTTSILPTLNIAADVLGTAEYTITCSDNDTGAALQQSLAEFETVRYEVLDIGQDVSDDKKEKIDLIIARDVSSISEDILKITKSLLNKEGRLCIIEDAESARAADGLLERAGLVKVARFEAASGKQTAFIVAFNGDTISGHRYPSGEIRQDVVIVQSQSPSEKSLTLAAQLVSSLTSLGYNVSTVPWATSSIDVLKGKACITLAELEVSILHDLKDDDFMLMRLLILEASSVMWVNCLDEPTNSMMNGLARVVRNEVPGIDLRTLNAPQKLLSAPEKLSELISRVFRSGSADNEFLIKDGVVQVSRIVEDEILNTKLDRLNPQNGKMLDMMPICDAPGPLKLAVGTVGMLDSLCFEQDHVPRLELKSDEIEIKVKATALK